MRFGKMAALSIMLVLFITTVLPLSSAYANDGTGLTGYYYDNQDFTNFKFKRTDATVNFNWGSGSPGTGVGTDTFSVRWIGEIKPEYSETYTFTTDTDDGVRLWVNNQLVVDQWIDQASTEHSGTISLTAGQKYAIKLEYYDNGFDAIAKLYWSSPSVAKSIVPQTKLYPEPGIAVTNFTNSETINYALPLIRGTLTDTSATSLTLTNTSSSRSTNVMQAQVHQGRFKVFADLVPGENNLVLQSGTEQINFKVNYEPATSNAVTRIFWYVPSDLNTAYQTQYTNDPQNYADKLSTYAKVIQSFTADSMNKQGYGRKTINLEMNQTTGKVAVHILASTHPLSYYHNTTYNKNDLYGEVASLIPQQYPNSSSKNLTFVGFSKYDANIDYMYAHIALGGGDYGVFGGSTVWLFPNNETEVLSRFADLSAVDPDFVGEPATTVQKAISIGYGAALHELGHALGLPHEGGSNSIMWRGFDWLHRFFLLKDGNGYVFAENELPEWDPVSTVKLQYSPFLNATQPPRGLTVGGTITASGTNSPAGEQKEQAFDHSEVTKWLLVNSTGWIQYQFAGTDAHAVTSYKISAANDEPDRDPLAWTLSGSNDGTSWTTVDTRSNEDFLNRYQTNTYTFSNTTAYKYYKFDFTNNSGSLLQVAEIRLYE
ncbi:hypothetical protein K0T92_06895 [Paenibacillus oenotherae]|uniref:F5/8 type C domain-containing protein n=1 Tax=Paenibacillus oenotherae TaxID=1435645 RepID=A0ABS7D3I9_9BACL|nr:PA14 domain-containing protein [Paenibacillus oenotherae]MBW7474468.1 hypothetical protein [Paenibacillus oenotherae]